jgi:hypothetical protein
VPYLHSGFDGTEAATGLTALEVVALVLAVVDDDVVDVVVAAPADAPDALGVGVVIEGTVDGSSTVESEASSLTAVPAPAAFVDVGAATALCASSSTSPIAALAGAPAMVGKIASPGWTMSPSTNKLHFPLNTIHDTWWPELASWAHLELFALFCYKYDNIKSEDCGNHNHLPEQSHTLECARISNQFLIWLELQTLFLCEWP